MKKQLFIAALASFCCLSEISAQSYNMVVAKKDGTADTISTAIIDKVTFSEVNDDWVYTLKVYDPDNLEYIQTSSTFGVISYREPKAGDNKEIVAWNVTGFDANNDGVFSMDEKPDWLKSIDSNGKGGITREIKWFELNASEFAIVDEGGERSELLRNAAVRGTETSPYDLSMYDIKGNSTQMNTANCYVISAPGFYKLPLVYGNAIKDGATNTLAFVSDVTEEGVLARFIDHKDNEITSPYLYLTNNNAYVPTSASIVWADESSMIDNLAVSSDKKFLTFNVTKENIKQGNVIVAVKDADGNIMWSWHLWFAPDDCMDKIKVANNNAQEYYFSKECIGMKLSSYEQTSYGDNRSLKIKIKQEGAGGLEGVITIFQNGTVKTTKGVTGTIYEFGRKDPFPGTEDVAVGELSLRNKGNVSIGTTIQNPSNYYGAGTTYDWCNTVCHNLWSSNKTSLTYPDAEVNKTIYDPSPVGFHVPAPAAFHGFTTTSTYSTNPEEFNVSGVWNEGWNFYTDNTKEATIFFPAAGYRWYNDGALKLIGDYGYYWSAFGVGNYFAMGLYFKDDGIGPDFWLYKADGFPVRPVSE